MQRVTISLEDALAVDFDAVAQARGYQNRSEAVRDLMRQAVEEQRTSAPDGWCVAALSYVYNHHERGMAARLVELGHAHHDLFIATTHVHLDHDNCLETVMLRGPVAQVRALADTVRAERGVRHGQLNLISVQRHDHHHEAENHHHHGGGHLEPAPG